MFKQKFTGSIQQEHISWWKPYWIKSINLEIYILLLVGYSLKYLEGKPSVRVITRPNSSDKRELLVLKIIMEVIMGKRCFNFLPEAKQIAKQLIIHRLWNGLTQEKVAASLGVTFQQYQKLRNVRTEF